MSREQRITLSINQPNPLFEKWMEEWLNYAEQKDSMKKYVLRKALESLRKYPLVLHSGRDCAILEGFGSTICQMIDKQLIAYKTQPNKPPVQTEVEHNASVHEVVKEVQRKLNKKKANNQKPKDKNTKSTEDMLNDSNLEMFATVDLCNLEQLPTTSSMVNPLVFQRNSFEIILLVDSCETIG